MAWHSTDVPVLVGTGARLLTARHAASTGTTWTLSRPARTGSSPRPCVSVDPPAFPPPVPAPPIAENGRAGPSGPPAQGPSCGSYNTAGQTPGRRTSAREDEGEVGRRLTAQADRRPEVPHGRQSHDHCGDQSHWPPRYPCRTTDRGVTSPGTGAHRPRRDRCGGGPYGDCQAGRSVRPEPPTSWRRTTGSGSSSAARPVSVSVSLSCRRFRSSGCTERTFVRSRTVSLVLSRHPAQMTRCRASRGPWFALTRSLPFARQRPEAHLGQRRRTIGGQVGTTTQFLNTEIHRFQ